MRKLVCSLLMMAMPLVAQAVFPTNSCINTVDVAKVTGNWDSYRWNWNGMEDQWCRLFVNENGTWLDLSSYSVAFKVSKKVSGTSQTTYISLDATSVSVLGSNITFSIPYTNIPADGRYLSEVWLYTGTPVQARVLAQGYVDTHNSLYANDDSTFPWPTNQDILANYVLLTDPNYLAAVTNTGSVAGGAFGLTTASRISTLTYPSTSVTSGTQTAGGAFSLTQTGGQLVLGYPSTVNTATTFTASGNFGASQSGGTLALTYPSTCATSAVATAGGLFNLVLAANGLTLSYPSTALTNLTGDTEIVVGAGVNDMSKVLSIGSAVARDTEVSAASSGVYSASSSYADAAVTALSNSAAILGEENDFTGATQTMLTNKVHRLIGPDSGGAQSGARIEMLGTDNLRIYPAEGRQLVLYSRPPSLIADSGSIYSTWLSPFLWTVQSNLTVLGDATVAGTMYGTATNASALGGRTESTISNASALAWTAADNTLSNWTASTYLPLSGAVPMAGDLNFGWHSLTNLYGFWLAGQYITNVDTTVGTDLTTVSNMVGALNTATNSYLTTNDNRTVTLPNLTGSNSTLFAGSTQAGYSNLLLSGVGLLYLPLAGGVISGGLQVTGTITNTATTSLDCSLFVTNVPAWERVLFGPYSTDRTFTQFDVIQNGASCTVVVASLTNGASIGDAGTTMNSLIATGATNSVDTTWSSATLTAGQRLKVSITDAASDYAAGTNDVHVTLRYTRATL